MGYPEPSDPRYEMEYAEEYAPMMEPRMEREMMMGDENSDNC
jgi:hypothetical protein